MSKRIVFVVVAALALASPATASALTLKDGGQEVKDQLYVQTGNFKFVAAGGTSISCPMKLTFTINGQTVTVSKFELTVGANACSTAGRFANCYVSAYTPMGLPWAITVDADALTVKSVEVKTTLASVKGKVCPDNGLRASYDPWVATPDNPKAITAFTWSGVGKGVLESESEAESEIEIEATNESHGEEENPTYEIA